MTVLYRIDTAVPGVEGVWCTRAIISSSVTANRVAAAFTDTEGVKATITRLDLADPDERDNLVSYINWLIEHQRGTRRRGPRDGTPTPGGHA